MKTAILFLLCLLNWTFKAHAYPNFIGYGYTSCATCHYNSLGNGPLTDYGRAISASAISGRLFIPSSVSDETLAEYSGFLGKARTFKWLRPSFDARWTHLTTGFAQRESRDRLFWMQLDANVVLKFGKNDAFLVSVTGGFTPDTTSRRSPTDEVPMIFISREHYVSYMPVKRFRVYAGKMDRAFGLRVPDHEAYSRRRTRNAQNDQVHGVVAHYFGKKADIAVHGYAGDLSDFKENRLKGASLTGEFEPASLLRVGGSAMTAKNVFTKIDAASIHTRMAAGKGVSVIAESGYVWTTPTSATLSRSTALYFFGQTQLRLFRGMHILWSAEYLNSDVHSATADKQLRMIPGIQYFPWQRVELRADFINSRTISRTSVSPDSWTVIGQVHVSL